MRQTTTKQRLAESQDTPAPIGGINARDGLDGIPERDALQLDNWFPGAEGCETRAGNAIHATSAATVETLYSHKGTVSLPGDKFFACTDGKIFDATNPGAVGAPLASGFTSNRWQGTTFKGNTYLSNGVDSPQRWNGTTMQSASWTGSVTSSKLINPTVVRQRVFYVEKDSAKAWFGAVGAVSGGITALDLEPLAPNGGPLLAIGTWTRDGGSGPDDLTCFFFKNGDVLIYRGTDPAVAGSWSLVGTFTTAPPLGNRCLLKYGSDLVVITQDGYAPLSRLLPTARTSNAPMLSDKISGMVRTATKAQPTAFGWQPIIYPKGGWGLFNVPTGSGFQQHVRNLDTGAWCRFTGLEASCWAVHNEDLYFGTVGGVRKADTGTSDNGAAITATARTAFNHYGRRSTLKAFNGVRPVMTSTADIPLSVGFDVDFKSGATLATGSANRWNGVRGHGRSGAVTLQTVTDAQRVQWHSTDVRYIPSFP